MPVRLDDDASREAVKFNVQANPHRQARREKRGQYEQTSIAGLVGVGLSALLGRRSTLRNDSVSVGLGILPDLPIVRLLQTRSANVSRVRKEVTQSGRKSMA